MQLVFLSQKLSLRKLIKTGLTDTMFTINRLIETDAAQPPQLLSITRLVHQRINSQGSRINLASDAEGTSMIRD